MVSFSGCVSLCHESMPMPSPSKSTLPFYFIYRCFCVVHWPFNMDLPWPTSSLIYLLLFNSIEIEMKWKGKRGNKNHGFLCLKSSIWISFFFLSFNSFNFEGSSWPLSVNGFSHKFQLVCLFVTHYKKKNPLKYFSTRFENSYVL